MHVVFDCGVSGYKYIVVETAAIADFDHSIRLREGAETAIVAKVTFFANDTAIAGLEFAPHGRTGIDNRTGSDDAVCADAQLWVYIVAVFLVAAQPLTKNALRADTSVFAQMYVFIDDCAGLDCNIVSDHATGGDDNEWTDADILADLSLWTYG